MCDRYYFRAAPVINQNIVLNDGHFILATRVVVANHRLMTHTLNFIKIFFHHSFIQYYFHEVRGQNIRHITAKCVFPKYFSWTHNRCKHWGWNKKKLLVTTWSVSSQLKERTRYFKNLEKRTRNYERRKKEFSL
jgi:hypothetical protein